MNLWLELGKAIIKKGAPLLGGIIGGPGGAAIGGLLARVFGGDPADPVDLLARVNSDNEAMLKLAEIESTNEVRLAEIAFKNTESARSREVEVTKATGQMNWPMYVLAAIIVLGFFGVMLAMFFRVIPEGSKEIAFMLFGGLLTNFGAVVNYFFGSSKGSADKDKLIAIK